MKKLLILTCAAAVLVTPLELNAASPVVSDVLLEQDAATHTIAISYTLVNAPAIVTVDLKTGVGNSIGGAALRGLTGDLNKVIDTDGSHEVSGRIDTALPAGTVVHAEVTAWPLDNPPDYMATDLTRGASGVVRYYTDVESLPTIKGPTDNVYRLNQLLCKRIHAKGVAWDMGPNGSDKHSVTLDHDYYMGVFEVTQKQWYFVNAVKSWPSKFTYYGDVMGRPVENVSYENIRGTTFWPDDPTAGTFLYKLRDTTGVAFDLPGEAEWEYAARGGHSNGVLGDGSARTEANLLANARYQTNGKPKNASGTYYDPPYTVDSSLGTAIVGSYRPNDYGLYDMLGNMWEKCLDVYDDEAHPVSSLSGEIYTTISGSTTNLTIRGGCYLNGDSFMDFTRRSYSAPSSASGASGFRVVVRLAVSEAMHVAESVPIVLDMPGMGSFIAATLDARSVSKNRTAAIRLNSYPSIGMYFSIR